MRHILISILLLLGVGSLSAREVYNINRGWQFFYSSEQSADNARYINLPHTLPPQSAAQAKYFKKIYAPAAWSSERVFIRFYGVQRCANLFINGRFVGEHQGGSTAFTFEITEFIKVEDNNTIFVEVDNSPRSDLLPTSVEHIVEGGIYRDVEIIVTPQSAISPTFYSSEGIFLTTTEVSAQEARGFVRVHISQRERMNASITLSFTPRGGSEVFTTTKEYTPSQNEWCDIPFEIKRPKLWSPYTPNLYDITARLKTDEEEDVVTIQSGLRVISTENKNSVMINSKVTPIQGVALYHDHPLVGGALTKKEYVQDMDIIQELGATAIRSAVYPHDRELYKICDQRGIVAWVDTPLHRTDFLSDVGYYPTPRFEENAKSQFREIIAQNYNHPSIIMWGLFTTLSSRGDDYTPLLHELKTIAEEADPTRPTVALSNQNGAQNNIPDLIAWRQNLGWDRGSLSDIGVWREMLHSQWGYMSSAVSYGEGGDIENQSKFSQSARRINDNGEWYPEGRARGFHNEYAKELIRDTLFWGVWQNAMFDFRSSRRECGKNYSGLVSFSRQERKDIFYLYKSLWNRGEKTLYIASRRNTATSMPTISILIYASDESTPPTLHVAGKTYTTHLVAPSQFRADGVEIDGRCEVIARQGKLTDSVVFIYDSPEDAKEN